MSLKVSLKDKPFRSHARRIVAHWRFLAGGNHKARQRVTGALKTLGGGVAYGAFVEPYFVQTTQIEFVVPDLPFSMDGYRIAHLTDVHFNLLGGKSFLQRIVEKTNSLDPDMVVLTGDFITHNAKNLNKCMAILGELKAPDGLWAVRGNHDHRASKEHFSQACESHGINFIENEHYPIFPERLRRHSSHEVTDEFGSPPQLILAGVGDLWMGDCHPGSALEGADPSLPTILLSHHGQCANLLTSNQRVDLILSGHTHGGQIQACGKSSPIFTSGSNEFVSGMISTQHTHVYISRGVGTSAFRFRWNCRPEIALIQLHQDTGVTTVHEQMEPKETD